METHLKPQSELRIIIKTYLEHSYQTKVLIKDSISQKILKFEEKFGIGRLDESWNALGLFKIQKHKI